MKKQGLSANEVVHLEASGENGVTHLPPKTGGGESFSTRAAGTRLSEVSPEPIGMSLGVQNKSIVRAGKGRELGTFKPVRVDFIPLGGTLGYSIETFELTPFSFVICEDTEDGERIDLQPGSTLIDGKIHVLNEHDLDCTVPFIGKVTEEVEIQSERYGHCLGYLIRIAQISIDDQDTLTRALRAMEMV